MKTFLGSGRPLLTMMLKEETREGLFAELEKGLAESPDAIGYSAGGRAKELQTPAFLGELFSRAGDKPIYFTDYRRGNIDPTVTDEALADGLLAGLGAGATLIDVMGDIFCATPGELTRDETAVRRQEELIREIHARGGEVLMSSHILKYTPKEEVLAVAREHIKRGADISKIVTEANSEEELCEVLETSLLLRRSLGAPFLFLCNGTHCRLHRRLSAYLGNCLYLVTEDGARLQPQPRISSIRPAFRDICEEND